MRFLLLLLCVAAAPLSAQTPPTGSPVDRWGALHVAGTQLTSQNGEAVALRGMSLFDTSSYGEYANPQVLTWLRDDWKATVFRAAMYTSYNGQFVGEAAYGPLLNAVQSAVDSGLYVLVDWHILNDGNPMAHVKQAKEFFARVAERFGDSPAVLYEICNEPNGAGVTWADAIKPYALEVIPVIRAKAPNSVIVVGTPEWSSHPEIAAADPLPFANLLYTLHFYAATHDHSYLDRIDQAKALGSAVFVTEWGAMDSKIRGPVQAAKAVAFVRELAARRISWANWSLGTKLESASALKPLASVAGSWRPGELTENGLLMRSLLRDEPTAVVFADTFQSGNFKAGGWVRSGVTLARDQGEDGRPAVRFQGKASLVKPLLSEAYRGWTWSYRARAEGWRRDDRFFVEWSADGNVWNRCAEVRQPAAGWVDVKGSLPEAVDKRPGIQVRLRAELASDDASYWVEEAAFEATRD